MGRKQFFTKAKLRGAATILLAVIAAMVVGYFAASVSASAEQAAAVPVDGVQAERSIIDLSSTGGVLVATMLLLQFAKTSLADVPGLHRIPIWMYAVVVSGILTWLAHDVLLTLHGDLPHLLQQTLFGAMSATGGYEWLRHGLGKPISAAGT